MIHSVSFPHQNTIFYRISCRVKKEEFAMWEFPEIKILSFLSHIHDQNSSKHDRIFQKLTFPIKEVLLLFFLENWLFFFFYSVWTDPYFKAHEALTWNDFSPQLLVGDRHTLATSTSLASICTTLDCIQFNCSHTFSLDSLQKNFCVVLLLIFIAA